VTNTAPSSQPFSLDHFGETIAAFLDQGYTMVNFADLRAAKRHLVLRHDIDFDLQVAAKMAEFEAEKGIRATYFVLLRTEFYNVFSQSAVLALGRIAASGHDIGLHFDAALYQGDEAELIRAAQEECQILSQAVHREIGALSFHRPHPDILGREIEFDGVLNAYNRRFFEDIGYCSDSKGAWHHGPPLNHEAVAGGRALQLLTHPIWWVDRDGSDAQDTVARFLNRHQHDLAQEAGAHCAAYKPPLKGGR
jgi:hypothetical protein